MENKYMLIYRDIAEKIRENQIKKNTRLPSEFELMEIYEVSRETVRKALNLLAQNGYIQKIRGKGSIVLEMNKIDFPVSGLVSFKELAKSMGKRHKTTVQYFNLENPDFNMMNNLNLKPSDEIWAVKRIREIDGEKVILDKDYINRNFIEHLTEEICSNSIYEYIEKDLGLTISFAKKEITVKEPSEEDYELLDLEGFHNIVVVKNFVHLDNASLFQYTESRHRPDMFRFIDFARRV